MGFVLHMLAPNDLFVDVGANIGSYTVMAAGAVGASVIAVEPVPTTFKKLLANIAVNGIAGKVEAHCLGLSASSGEIVFTAGLDTMNRVALPGEDLATVSVPVRTLDELTAGLTPRLIKIDVEGHETAVLAGGSDTLSRPSLEAVLMETNGSGAKYGVSDESLMETMRGHGFEPCSYDALKRKISPTLHRSRNTIFIRDRRAAEARCKAAERYSLINGSI
jgi:FkbM family methyltransferase